MYLENLYSSTSTFLAEVEVGKHFYWNIGGFLVHGQVLLVLWLVFAVLLLFAFLGSREVEQIPRGSNKIFTFGDRAPGTIMFLNNYKGSSTSEYYISRSKLLHDKTWDKVSRNNYNYYVLYFLDKDKGRHTMWINKFKSLTNSNIVFSKTYPETNRKTPSSTLFLLKKSF